MLAKRIFSKGSAVRSKPASEKHAALHKAYRLVIYASFPIANNGADCSRKRPTFSTQINGLMGGFMNGRQTKKIYRGVALASPLYG